MKYRIKYTQGTYYIEQLVWLFFWKDVTPCTYHEVDGCPSCPDYKVKHPFGTLSEAREYIKDNLDIEIFPSRKFEWYG